MTAYTSTDALVDIESEGPEWLEWCAAMYESYAADCEDTDTSRTPGAYKNNMSLTRYSNAAARVAEDLEYKIYHGEDY